MKYIMSKRFDYIYDVDILEIIDMEIWNVCLITNHISTSDLYKNWNDNSGCF
jgi:succinyl-CoA synthetase alpha subunit